MKKVVLSLAGMLAATAFAPEASAIPAFARQTGMACSACHFQHFPVLNGFGQAFKASGFTLMGAQGRIEGEHLSLPDTLNGAILLKARYQKTGGTDPVGQVAGSADGNDGTNGGQWQIPDELSLFFGGRVADNDSLKVGFMMENNLVGGPVGGIIAGLRVPVVIESGAAKILAIPYLTDSLGAGYGFEQSSTGAVRGVRWGEHRKDISAAQYVGIGAGAASGIALVAHTDYGYINLSRYAPHFAYAAGTTGVQMSSTWLRVAATPTVGDWALHIGAAAITGTNYNNADGTAPVAADKVDTKGRMIDLQAQGTLGGNETSVYAQYAIAPATPVTANTTANFYNGKASKKEAVTVGIDYSVIPHTLHIGGSMRMANTGMSAAQIAAGNVGDKDNAYTLTIVYDLAQNVALHLNHSVYSGSSYDATGTNKSASLVGGNGKSLTTFLFETAF